ncbi:MAG: AAA family ATPase [Microscillaceae bacterium]|jgi:ABC-type lipoprotein export system ATPase subunit|nr:AAA family ATPase [Microscillaceae bacterium]
MIRLNKLYIKGFKDPDREINLEFSKEPISVIYGPNGSGKTTLLKVLSALFKGEFELLRNENIQYLEIEYLFNQEVKNIQLDLSKRNLELQSLIKELSDTKSLLSGVYRGLEKESPRDFIIYRFLLAIKDAIEREKVKFINLSGEPYYNFDYQINDFIELEQGSGLTEELFGTSQHPIYDFIRVKSIKDIIKNRFKKGNDIITQKIKKATFDTVANSVAIELNQEEEFNLPENFWERLSTKKDFLLKTIEGSDTSYLKDSLISILEKGKTDNGILKSKIFRAFLINILEKAEEENIELKAVTTLIEIFNDNLYRDKKLVVSADDIYIDLGNNRRHELEDLSSGERHLLSFLTLFLIIGRGRDFFLIDEPEISLHTKWQRELLPLLSELSPESQIIVATHSPSIANRNTNYIVELK